MEHDGLVIRLAERSDDHTDLGFHWWPVELGHTRRPEIHQNSNLVKTLATSMQSPAAREHEIKLKRQYA